MIRKLLIAFGALGALITVTLVARHGYLSAETQVDGIALAAMLAFVALGGLVGHAVAAHVWPVNRLAGAAVFMLATAALLLNLSTSFEAIIGRAAGGEAERAQHIQDRKTAEADLASVTAELTGLRDHVPVTDGAVAAAREKASAATEQRKAECNKRGARCRDREADERTAIADLSQAEQARAITQRVATLETQAATLTAKLAAIPATAHSNTMAAGLGRLFKLPDVDAVSAAAWHKLAIAAIVELLIAAAFFAAEIMRPRHALAAPAPLAQEPVKTLQAITQQDEIDPKPVIDFLRERVVASPGSRVALPELFLAYQTSDHPPMAAAQFGAAMREICERVQWPVEADGKLVYLANRKLKQQTARRALGHMARAAS